MTASNPGESDQEKERRTEEEMRELPQSEEQYRTLFSERKRAEEALWTNEQRLNGQKEAFQAR